MELLQAAEIRAEQVSLQTPKQYAPRVHTLRLREG